MEKKEEEGRVRKKKTTKNPNKTKRGEVGEMNRWLETDHIQSQQTVPLFTKGRLKGSNVKGLQHF